MDGVYIVLAKQHIMTYITIGMYIIENNSININKQNMLLVYLNISYFNASSNPYLLEVIPLLYGDTLLHFKNRQIYTLLT